MAAIRSKKHVAEEYLNDIEKRGQGIYEKLKAQLEPRFNDQYVVIHVDTEDYAVAPIFTVANRTMMTRQPVDGRLFGRRIGSKPDDDFVARMTAFDVLAGHSK